MSALEKDVVKRVKDWCDKNGVLYIKFTPFGSKGWPDTIIVFPGGFHLWVELKRAGKKPRPLQQHRMGQLAVMGALAVWFDNADAAIEYLQDCLDSAMETMDEMGTTPVPDTGNKDTSEADRGGAIIRPWDGKDGGGPRRF